MKTELNYSTFAKWIKTNEYEVCLIVFLIAYFFYNFFNGLNSGGRWDLCQHIATADRFLAGEGFFYSPEFASSPYFPGVSFLSIIVSIIANPIRDYVLLFIAAFIGTFFIYQLLKFTSTQVEDKWLVLSTMILLLLFTLKNYQSYMCEFKPDTVVLIIGIYLLGFSRKIITNNFNKTLLNWIIISALTFVMGLFKQHALYLDFGIGLYILFSKEFFLRNKIFFLSAMLMGGILDIVVLFAIPNLPLLTMQNLSDMPYFKTKEILFQIYNFVRNNIFLELLLLFYIVQIITRKIKISNELKQYFFMVLPFILGQVWGAYKIGGNDGNTEVAIITLLPFALISISLIIKTSEKYFKTISIFIIGLYWVLMIPTSIFSFYKSNKNIKTIITYLSKYKNETFMYYSNLYMPVFRSGIIIGMDMYSVPVHTKPYFYEQVLNEKKYKYIIFEDSKFFEQIDASQEKYRHINTKANLYFKNNYQEVIESDMPENLKGKIYVLKNE